MCLLHMLRFKPSGEFAIASIWEWITTKISPDVTMKESHHYTVEEDGIMMVRNAYVAFDFPGAVHGPAHAAYSQDHGNRSYQRSSNQMVNTVGPPEIEVTCCGGDVDAYRLWRDAKKMKL